jgi:hypothetical protein
MFANNKTENDKNREGVVGRPTSLRLNTLTFDGSLNLTTPSTGLITPSQLPGNS